MGDAYLGCLTPAQLNTTNCPKGNICWAPQNYNGDFPQDSGCSMTAYKYHNYSTPWIDRVIKESCVCGNGRFAGIYAANGIGCPSGIVPPP
jgi:hypothetical protein